jgi:hypothetical protein
LSAHPELKQSQQFLEGRALLKTSPHSYGTSGFLNSM